MSPLLDSREVAAYLKVSEGDAVAVANRQEGRRSCGWADHWYRPDAVEALASLSVDEHS